MICTGHPTLSRSEYDTVLFKDSNSFFGCGPMLPSDLWRAMSTCWLWNMYPWSCVWLFSYKTYWVIIEQSKLELWCVPRKIPQGCPVQFTLIWSWWGEQTWIVLNIQCVFWNARFSFLAHPSCTSFDVNSINSTQVCTNQNHVSDKENDAGNARHQGLWDVSQWLSLGYFGALVFSQV